MQTAAQITAQINQIKREIVDIDRNLPTIISTTDLLGAKAELRDRAEVLDLLTTRLEDARRREQVQEEQARRAELEQERDAATAEHAELDEAFETEMLDGEAYIIDLLDRLDAIATQRGNCEARRANATFELRGRQVDWSNTGQLSTGAGWYSNATPNARSAVRQALFELYAARYGMYGKLQLPGQDDGHRGVFGIAPRPQELAQPDPDDAFRAQVVAEYAAKNG